MLNLRCRHKIGALQSFPLLWQFNKILLLLLHFYILVTVVLSYLVCSCSMGSFSFAASHERRWLSQKSVKSQSRLTTLEMVLRMNDFGFTWLWFTKRLQSEATGIELRFSEKVSTTFQEYFSILACRSDDV